MNLLTLFRKRRAKLVLIRRFSSRITLDEWRSTEDLVKQAREYLNDPKFATIIDVLSNASPHNFVRFDYRSNDERVVEQARTEGYQLCLNNLMAMGSLRKPETEIEPTYEQTEETEVP